MTPDRVELKERRRQLLQELAQVLLAEASLSDTVSANGDRRAELTRQIRDRLEHQSEILMRELIVPAEPEVAEEVVEKERTFLRFGMNFRAQHMLMFVSVILLIVTGMPLKFPEWGISHFVIIDLFGGIERSTLVHRIAAAGLIIVGAWHMAYVVVSRIGRRDFFLMLPRWQDIKDFFQTLGYFLGRKTHGPKFGRFSFIEKFDYWAVYWGMVIMIGSGLILWFKELFPKEIFDIAREAHSDEGLLATLAIIGWHFYNVHFNPEVFPMSWVWWHGRLTESELKHHHPLEYEELTAESEIQVAEEASDTGG